MSSMKAPSAGSGVVLSFRKLHDRIGRPYVPKEEWSEHCVQEGSMRLCRKGRWAGKWGC